MKSNNNYTKMKPVPIIGGSKTSSGFDHADRRARRGKRRDFFTQNSDLGFNSTNGRKMKLEMKLKVKLEIKNYVDPPDCTLNPTGVKSEKRFF